VRPIDKLNRAIDFLAQGEWQRAHTIAQEDESKNGCWIHGIVHVLEGDLDNARYWYRRAGRTFPEAFSIEAELVELRSSL
jgi:hypothetical protein